MSLLWNQEWLQMNGQRKFPLADFASGVDQTGAFTLPDSFLLELTFPIHVGQGFDPSRFYLSKIASTPAGYTLTIGYAPADSSPPTDVAVATFLSSTHVENDSYALPGVSLGSGDPLGGFEDSTGAFTVGALAEINAQSPGEYTFDFAGGALDLYCIRPYLRGVSSLTLVNNGVSSPPLYGDIELAAGDNIRLSYTTIVDFPKAYVRIQIDADASAGALAPCACPGNTTALKPIQTINGILPDAANNFTLQPTPCIQINAITNGLQLADLCSQPCCGCDELTALFQEVGHMGDEANTLKAYVDRLKSQVDNFGNVVLGSKLSDSPCVTCT